MPVLGVSPCRFFGKPKKFLKNVSGYHHNKSRVCPPCPPAIILKRPRESFTDRPRLPQNDLRVTKKFLMIASVILMCTNDYTCGN